MNLATLKTHVKRNLGNRTDLDTLILQWINDAYLDLVTAAKFPEFRRFEPIPCPSLDTSITFQTEDGVASYAQLQNVLFIISARNDTTNKPLFRKDIRWYDLYHTTTEGTPSYYVVYGGLLYLEPTPDDEYDITLRVRQQVDVPALVNDNDEPVIDKLWHEAIVLGASYRGAHSLGYPDSDKWYNRLKAFVVSHSEQHTEEESNALDGIKVVL